MKKPENGAQWVYHKDLLAENVAEGVTRRVAAYCDKAMCVENTFEVGAIGALHSHPHTQITYVASGKFEFEIDGVKNIVTAGDTLLKAKGEIHGAVCLEKGVLIDFFAPMREDFV